MRSLAAAVIAAGVLAQVPGSAPGTAPVASSFAFQSQPQATFQSQPQVSTASFGASSSVGSSAPQAKGIPLGTNTGIKDSDVACAQGYSAACGLPNIASIYNPNPNMRYQTQASDLALSMLTSTGHYDQNGNRIAGPGALSTVDIPKWTAGGLVNSGGVYTTGQFDLSRTPIAGQTNYITSNPAAPNAFTPSASNSVLPQSVAFAQANLAPWTTTAPNALTSAGFGYSTNLKPAQTTYQSPLAPVGASPFSGLGASPLGWSSSPVLPSYNFGSQFPAPQFPASQFPPQFAPTQFGTQFGTQFPPTQFTGFNNVGLGSSNFGLGTNYNFLPGTSLSTQPAFTNAYTPSQFGVAPALGVAPQAGQQYFGRP